MPENKVKQIEMEVLRSKLEDEVKNCTLPWRKPWSIVDGAVSYNTGKPYHPYNQFLLDVGEWLTFSKIKELGGEIIKGEKSSLLFGRGVTVKKDKDTGEEVARYGGSRFWRVWEVHQTTLQPKWSRTYRHGADGAVASELIGRLKSMADRIGVTVKDGAANFYKPSEDSVTVVDVSHYENPIEAVNSLAHELVHSTGAPSRLNRHLGDGFGSITYSKEELVAEIGATMVLNKFGFASDVVQNNAAYIRSWESFMLDNPEAVETAFRDATTAVNYLFNEDAE